MKMIKISNKWAVAEHHIVDIWLSGDGHKIFNLAYDIPQMAKGTLDCDTTEKAQAIYDRVLAQLEDKPSIDEEDE